MAASGRHWIVTDPHYQTRRLVSPSEAAETGFDKAYDRLSFDQIVKAAPGATREAKLKHALDDVLGNYMNHYETALGALQTDGASGLISYTSTGLMVGPRALAGAMRAARKNPTLHKLDYTDEWYSAANMRSMAAKQGAKNRRPKDVIAREKADLERRRDEAERLYGTRDLRKIPTAGQGRRERLQQANRANRESYNRAVKAATQARKAYEKQQRQAAKAAAKKKVA